MAIPSRRNDYQSVASTTTTYYDEAAPPAEIIEDTQETSFHRNKSRGRSSNIRRCTLCLCSPTAIASICLCLAIVLTIYISKPILDQINENNANNKHYDLSAAAAYEKLNGQIESKGRGSKGSSSESSVSLGCEGTVMIIRHCEKYLRGAKHGSDFQHCNYVGFERAHYLATLFGDGDERWPAPAFIYSMGSTKSHHHVHREVETVTTISKKLKVPIETKYSIGKEEDLANDLIQKLRAGEMCGNLALISWKHEDIPRLAHNLGCGIENGCPRSYPETFDEAWQIKFVYDIPVLGGVNGKDNNPNWHIYGSVQQEGFDPLAYSKVIGDYPKGGKPVGGGWALSNGQFI
mmetsp:Transcript_12624/g.18952  ORF Transcript_12624/g.18952 Transcript_12624/m.18952 type:complete len:348 (-) Transcript_12624:134-1177(-)|eukprot:CAMPEP_0196811714 /NCGR_PEP_ID=MMETSP1362-20130617/20015_1 /TAXON_ID=163516 /ORGANISM="Leptocylindrus danicus, Strain CCMP1856" /LENGTH=347 /DNA_ID=CAMNT_0042187091 /DNA_START=334 /DNA_END=1377 /DNA_ORIENTATION=+